MNCINCGSAIMEDEHVAPTKGGYLCEICLYDSPEKKGLKPSVIITPNIPPHATKLFFKGTSRSAFIYIWPNGMGKWYWEALGNGGEAENQEAAMRDARQWVRGEK